MSLANSADKLWLPPVLRLKVLHRRSSHLVPVPQDIPGAVCIHDRSQAHPGRQWSLRLGDAFRYGQDCIAAEPHCCLSEGESLALSPLWPNDSPYRTDGKYVPILLNPQFYPAARKLIYCSRTVPEIEKALAELKRLMEYRARYNDPGSNPPCQRDTPLPRGQGEQEEMLALGLSSRKNLCIHPSVGKERKGKTVDARCRDMTSAWACERGRKEPGSVELCDFHEVRGYMVP